MGEDVVISKLGSVWKLWIFQAIFSENFQEFSSNFSEFSCQFYFEINLWTLIVATNNVVLDLDSGTKKWKIPNQDSVAENSQRVI
jgi:hypothetical protein